MFTTIAAIYLLDYTLPLVAKLSKSLQTKQLYFSVISSLVDAVLHAMDAAINPAAFCVLEHLDSKDDLQQATGEIVVSTDKIHTFQETLGTPFVALGTFQAGLQLMILCQLWPYLILITFPVVILPNFSLMERCHLRFSSTLQERKFGLTLNDEETVKTAGISPEVHTEWITFSYFTS